MTQENHLPAQEPEFERTGIEWDLFWQQNKTKILGGIGVAVCLVGAVVAWYVSQAMTTRAAESRLATAKDIPALERLVADFPRSMAAADALLRIASDQRALGKWTESTAAFNKFLQTFPDHQLAGGAQLGIAQNQEAQGHDKEAQESYQKLAAKFPKSYATFFGMYSQAEMLLRENKKDEASRVLDSIVAQAPPQSMFSQAASQRLVMLGVKKNAGLALPQMLPQ